MHTLTKQEKIIDTELSKIEGATNAEKGIRGNILTYSLVIKQGIMLHLNKIFHEKQEATQFQVLYSLCKGDTILTQGTIDIRELVRKCNSMIDENCFNK